VKYPLPYYLDVYSNALPFLAGSWNWTFVKKNLSGSALMFTFVVIGIITEAISYVMVGQGMPNRWVLHFYHLAEYILLVYMFMNWQREYVIRGQNKSRLFFILKPNVLLGSVVLYFAFWLGSKWSIEAWDAPASYTLTSAAFVFIVLSLLSLHQRVSTKSPSPNSIFRSFQFWTAFGVLIYFSGSAVHFLILHLLVNLPAEKFLEYWTLHWYVNVIANIAYAIGFFFLNPPAQA